MIDHLSTEDLAEFERNGVLVLRSFFDTDRDIAPIQEGIYAIIGLLLEKYEISGDRPPFDPATFDVGYRELLLKDRGIGGEVYDAIKQIPAFMQFCSHQRLVDITRQIRNTGNPGIAAGGYGIRIDNPNEERYRATWHQDYTAQFRSIDGLVFWSPLVPIKDDMGAVEFCVGSHKAGPIRVHDHNPQHPEKTGAYSLTLESEEVLVDKFERIAPLTAPTDLVIIDYLTIHRSGFNTSERSRWSMQLRYFNFEESSGVSHGWKGGAVAGVPINDVHPRLLIDRPTL